MKVTPNVHYTTLVEQPRESGRALSRCVLRHRTSSIKRAVPHRVEVTAHNGGNRGINPGGNQIEKLVSCRVTVGSIQRDYTKQFGMKTKFAQHKTTIIIRRKFYQRQGRTEEHNTTTRLFGPRRHNSLETGRTEPRLTLNIIYTMDLLKTHNIPDHRERT